MMTNKKLRQFLINLGFESGAVTDKNYRVLRHPDSGCVLLIPDNKTLEQPVDADLHAVRTHLTYRGHITGAVFDTFIETGELPAAAK